MSIRLSGMNSGLDTDAMVKDLVKAYSKKTEKMKKKQTSMEWKQEAWTSLNTKIKNFYSKNVSNMKYSSSYSKKITKVSDETKASVVSADNAVVGTQTLQVNHLAKAAYLTGGELKTADGGAVKSSTTLGELGYNGDDIKITINKGIKKEDGTYATSQFDLTRDTKISDVVKYLGTAGLNASFDTQTGRFFINSKNSGESNNFDFEISNPVIADIEGESEEDRTRRESRSKQDTIDVLSTLGLLKKDQIEKSGITPSKSNVSYGSKIDGESAEIVLNGATFKSDSNTFAINGLTITAKELTGDSVISLNTDTDYDAVYDNIKNFIKGYNEIINELDKLYNAESSKGYEPLTSEEKEAMSDDEIEKWEEKIKSALLRRDENVNSVANAMKQAMLSTVDIDGKKYSLSSFGIETLGYFEAADNEKGAYHINGDQDDAAKSGEKDKLKSMIASNPKVTEEFFKQLSTNLYNSLDKLSKSSYYRSYGNFYDDKKMKTEYDDYKTSISKYEDYVTKMEDKYYKQFTAMEKAMGKVQSQQTYIGQLMG